MKKTYYALLVIIACWGCQLSHSNSFDDRADAEKIANRFYDEISKKDYFAADTLFTREFLSTTPTDSIHLLFTRTNKILGDFKSNKLKDWSTRSVSGSINQTEYLLTYDVEYSKYKAVETFQMIKTSDNEKPRIMHYHVASDGFFKWNK